MGSMRKRDIVYGVVMLVVASSALAGSQGVMALSGAQKNAISDHCDEMKDDLKKVQKDDARARVHLGSVYETILSKFIMPLNVRMVENGLSNADLVENQNNFSKAKAVFSDDYVNYQQKLEELVLVDCKKEPEDFYEKLVKVRQRRKVVDQDVVKLRELITQHIKLVTEARTKI